MTTGLISGCAATISSITVSRSASDLGRCRARPELIARGGPGLRARARRVIQRAQRAPHAIEHRAEQRRRRRDLGGHGAAVFVHRQRRGDAPQLERAVERKQRRRLGLVAQRVAVVDRLRIGQARHQQRLAVGRPRRRAALARHQLRLRGRLGPRLRLFRAFGPRRIDRGDPHRADAFADRVDTRARLLSGAHDGYASLPRTRAMRVARGGRASVPTPGIDEVTGLAGRAPSGIGFATAAGGTGIHHKSRSSSESRSETKATLVPSGDTRG